MQQVALDQRYPSLAFSRSLSSCSPVTVPVVSAASISAKEMDQVGRWRDRVNPPAVASCAASAARSFWSVMFVSSVSAAMAPDTFSSWRLMVRSFTEARGFCAQPQGGGFHAVLKLLPERAPSKETSAFTSASRRTDISSV